MAEPYREQPLLQELLAAEETVWRALQHGDPKADRAALSEDFLGVYPTGFSNRAEHAEQLADGPVVDSYALSEARVMDLGDGLALLAYRARFRRPDGVAQDWYISSLWRRTPGGWRNVFSQDTPAAR